MRAWLFPLLLLLPACAPQAAQPTPTPAVAQPAVHPVSGLPVIPLTITPTGGRPHAFRVEVAATEPQQARGLMFRTAMGADEGMIFPYDPPQMVAFWMKNTVIPLDIIFIGPDHRVINIAANATPYSEASLPAHYLPMRDFVQEQTLLSEDPRRIERYFGEARALAEELGVDLRLPRTRVRLHPQGTPGRQRCDWPWKGAYMSYQGYTMPCCMISTPDRYTLGDLNQQDFATLWNGPAHQQFRDQLDSDEPPEVCRSCAVYSGTF